MENDGWRQARFSRATEQAYRMYGPACRLLYNGIIIERMNYRIVVAKVVAVLRRR